jgi:threonyl-tRNA synthetase
MKETKMKTREELQELQNLRHSASHLLAHAVKRLFPDAKLGIGPAIENGFYYDFDYEKGFTESDLVNIEKEMEKIKGERFDITRFELSREDAIKLMNDRNEPYKVQLINELPEDSKISFYQQGEFIDLCAGPHLESVRKIKAFKLLSLTGAYWKGSEKNKMLQRIYGTAFDNGNDLTEHLKMLEEAKLRDHNKLGRELEFFTTVDVIGQGLPLIMPKGAKIIQLLQRFVEDEEERRGYLMTKTPLMAKKELYEISGHWQHYKEGMFVLGDEEKDEEVLALRPMTCPFQYFVYKSKLRSYRDLPLRYGETSTLFRNESSGEMHGLIRVRQFTISEGHLICRPDQLSDEFKGVIDLVQYMMRTLGIEEDVTYRFSKWDPNNKEKYVGSEQSWESSQAQMRQILDELKLPYHEVDGEAAFYGPKLDVQMKNVFGKEDTMITVQIDLALAENFDMSYVDSDGQKKRPFIIHRTSLGCYERTLAMLIEKYNGAFPVWLSPTQVKLMTVTEKFTEYAQEVKKDMEMRKSATRYAKLETNVSRTCV